MSEQDEASDNVPLETDEEWEEKMAARSPDEMIAYLGHITEAISTNPELSSIVPRELLDKMKAGLEKYEKQNEECKRLEQRSRVANALRDSTADAMLLESPDDKKGYWT